MFKTKNRIQLVYFFSKGYYGIGRSSPHVQNQYISSNNLPSNDCMIFVIKSKSRRKFWILYPAQKRASPYLKPWVNPCRKVKLLQRPFVTTVIVKVHCQGMALKTDVVQNQNSSMVGYYPPLLKVLYNIAWGSLRNFFFQSSGFPTGRGFPRRAGPAPSLPSSAFSLCHNWEAGPSFTSRHPARKGHCLATHTANYYAFITDNL